MCRAVPARVNRIEDSVAWVTQQDVEQRVSLLGIEGVVVGDYVLYHAGLVLARLDPEEAATVGDWVSLHWGWACEVLAERERANLDRYTRHHLAIANQTI